MHLSSFSAGLLEPASRLSGHRENGEFGCWILTERESRVPSRSTPPLPMNPPLIDRHVCIVCDNLRYKSKLGFQNFWFILPRIPYSWVAENTLILPTENENLARTWHFEFWVVKNKPRPPMGKLELECVETDRCIPRGYRRVCPVEAGAIPKVS